jgi:hypothetical protein
MAIDVGILSDELFMLHEKKRLNNERSFETIKEYAKLHNVILKDAGTEIFLTASTSLTYNNLNANQKIAYIDTQSFSALLYQCLDFSNFSPNQIDYNEFD